MNKDEILAKSRAENRNKDVYEQEVFRDTDICRKRYKLGTLGTCL